LFQNRVRRIAAGVAASTALAAIAVAPGPARAGSGAGDDMRGRIDAAAAASRAPGSRAAAPADQPVAPPTGPARLVVGYHPGTSATAMTRHLRGAGLSAQGNTSLARLGAQVVTVPRADDPDRLAAELRSDPNVAYVERDGVVRAAVAPNDPYYPQQTELQQITVPDAWSVTTGSAAVTIAVVDTGVTPVGDLAGAVLPGYDFHNNDADASDDRGYGTSEASLIAGRGDNGTGIAGVCWACKILPVKVVGADGSGPDSALVAGIVYAADRGVKIISITVIADGPSRALQDAVAYAQRKGALVIAPAGNHLSRFPLYPAAYNGVISVGGTDESSEPFIFCFSGFCTGTNYGPEWVDVAAPYCTTALVMGETVEYEDLFCGTGPATSLVSGTLALMKSKYPSASAAALAYSLTRGAQPTAITDFTAFGEIRAGTSIRTVDVTAPKITGATPKQNTRFRGTVTVTATGVSDTGSGVARADLYANGTYVGRDTTAPYAVKYASGKSNGTVKLQWRVYDRAGNAATYNRNLIADNKKPAVKITSAPKNGAKVKRTVTIKVSASDASGVKRVELLINGKVVARDTTAGYTFKINVSRYGKKMRVQVRAVDKVGNTATTATRTWKR